MLNTKHIIFWILLKEQASFLQKIKNTYVKVKNIFVICWIIILSEIFFILFKFIFYYSHGEFCK